MSTFTGDPGYSALGCLGKIFYAKMAIGQAMSTNKDSSNYNFLCSFFTFFWLDYVVFTYLKNADLRKPIFMPTFIPVGNLMKKHDNTVWFLSKILFSPMILFRKTTIFAMIFCMFLCQNESAHLNLQWFGDKTFVFHNQIAATKISFTSQPIRCCPILHRWEQ